MAMLVLSIGACRQNTDNKTQAGPPVKPVDVNGIVMQKHELDNKISSTGSLLANEEVEIRSEVPGRIISINFEEGSFIQKGALLVKINDDELQAQLKRLLLDEKLAKDDVYRKENLLAIKAVSQEELDKSQNQLGEIQAQIELVRSQLSKTSIYAPFSGKIGLRYVSPGGYISSSMLIAKMQETNPMKIEFTIPEKYISMIREGTEIQFHVEGSDSTFNGKVYATEPKIDPNTRSLTVRARCLNNGNILIPGAFARVEIILEKIPDALILPSEALIPDIKGEKVLTCKGGEVKTVYVNTGIRNERMVQVTDGLNVNDTVITTGLLQLRDKMKVNVRVQASR
jgi:membrane fusion protein (multidrug efflux system)